MTVVTVVTVEIVPRTFCTSIERRFVPLVTTVSGVSRFRMSQRIYIPSSHWSAIVVISASIESCHSFVEGLIVTLLAFFTFSDM